MYKALIADDEINICLLLRKLIDWSALNIEIVGQYCDGDELLNAIRALKPDIVVTDIRMPKLSGLEIVKICNSEKARAQFLLISGHAEFEYARMALEYGVENYLLKPINKLELENNLRKMAKKLDEEKAAAESLQIVQKKLDISGLLLEQRLISAMVETPASVRQFAQSDNYADYAEMFDGSHPFGRFAAVKCIGKGRYDSDEYQRLIKLVSDYLRKASKEIFPACATGVMGDTVYVFPVYDRPENFRPDITLLFDQLKRRFFEYCHFSLGAGTEIKASSEQSDFRAGEADKALSFYLNLGLDQIFFYPELPECRYRIDRQSLLREFNTALSLLDSAKTTEIFARLADKSAPSDLDVEDWLDAVDEICRDYLFFVNKLDKDLAPPLKEEFNNALRSSKDKRELLFSTRDAILSNMESLKASRFAEQSRYVNTVKEYVSAHIGENISLNDVSALVYMSNSYFSTFFKRSTGQNFSDYLVLERIEQSKSYLKNFGLSINDVAQKVGYQDARYFSKIFLKVVGLKPSEYRKLNVI